MAAKRSIYSIAKTITYTHIPCCVFVYCFFLVCTQNTSAQILNIQKYNCRLSQEDTETINKIAHYEAAFYDAVFETNEDDSLKININIFGRKDDFKKTPDGMNALALSSDGFYSAQTGDIFLLKTDHLSAALLHEISHAFLHHHLKQTPKWFDEGLATYFGSLIVQNNQIFYTPVIGRIERIKELQEKELLNLPVFLQNSSRNWGNDKKQITDEYTIAYSIIYFLVKTNLNLVKHLAVRIKSGQTTTAALTEIFGSMDFFESRYTNFYKQQN